MVSGRLRSMLSSGKARGGADDDPGGQLDDAPTSGGPVESKVPAPLLADCDCDADGEGGDREDQASRTTAPHQGTAGWSDVGFQVGDAGGVGDPGETPQSVNGLRVDGGEGAHSSAVDDVSADETTPLPLLPRRWHSAHCIRKRVTASRGRKA